MNGPASDRSVASGRSPWVHFGVAASLLLAVGGGWGIIMHELGLVMEKEAVPSPLAQANEKRRLENFPAKLGDYVLADGGIDEIPDDILGILGILGVTKDEHNWYYFARYRGTGRSAGGGPGEHHHVRLEITYYTAMLDLVPHVPERCLYASGATVTGSKHVSIKELSQDKLEPTAADPWGDLPVCRTTYVLRDHVTPAVQYHLFYMNGDPTSRWEVVRGRLALPWVKYCYFAKVQVMLFAADPEGRMLRPESDPQTCDEVCAHFLRQALPEIVRFLPSADDVERLKRLKSGRAR